jgi:protein-S-isoprenylcysteine O-methyltransferase Ste14
MGIKNALKKIANKRPGSPKKKRRALLYSPDQAGEVSKSASKVERNDQYHSDSINFRILAFAGGISIAITSLMGIGFSLYEMHAFDGIHILETIFFIFSFLLGILMCILESHFLKSDTVKKIRQTIIDKISPLKYLSVRGFLYILCGSLQISSLDSMNKLAGLFVVGVGILFIILAIHAKARMIKFKRAMKDPRKLQAQFAKYDKDGDGELNLEEFGNFLSAMTGENMNEDELQAAFGVVDKNDNGTLSLKELENWFRNFKGSAKAEEFVEAIEIV